MHPFLDHPSLQARKDIGKLKEVCDVLLDPEQMPNIRLYRVNKKKRYSSDYCKVIANDTAFQIPCGWNTVKRYANELVEMILVERTKTSD